MLRSVQYRLRWDEALIPQTLNDELLSLNLELTSLHQRNVDLQADNAQLLQRWLDRMQESVDGMNEDLERETGEIAASPVLVETAEPTSDETPVSQTPTDLAGEETKTAAPKSVEGKFRSMSTTKRETDKSLKSPFPATKPPLPTSNPTPSTTSARTASGSKVDERRKLFETKTTATGAAAAGKEGFRSSGKAK
jgi:hypothetical protein